MFVMQHFQISWEDALHYVQNRRYCISPNNGFITQIKVRRPAHPRTQIRKLLHPSESGLSQRSVINTSACFFVLLGRFVQEYEPIYKASVAVAQHPALQIDRSTSRRKRESDDDEEETGRYGILLFRNSSSCRSTSVHCTCDIGLRSVKLWTTTQKMVMTQTLWNYSALHHVHGCHLVSFHLMFVIGCIIPPSLSVPSCNASISRCPATSKAGCLPHNLMPRRFITPSHPLFFFLQIPFVYYRFSALYNPRMLSNPLPYMPSD